MRAFLNMLRQRSRKVKKSMDPSSFDLEPNLRKLDCRATQMDKDLGDHQIDPGLRMDQPANTRTQRTQLAAADESGEERVDGKGCLGDQVKSAYDQETIIKHEGPKIGGSDPFRTNADFGPKYEDEHQIENRDPTIKSHLPGPGAASAHRTRDAPQIREQDANGCSKQQGKVGQLRGHEQYREGQLAKLSPSFHDQHKISPADAKKEGSVLT